MNRRLTTLALLSSLTPFFALGAAASEDADMTYQSEPRVLDRNSVRVNELIPDLTLTTLADGNKKLSELAGPKGLVIALRDPECPLSKKYTPRLKELAASLPARGFGFVYAGVFDETMARKDVDGFELEASYAIDEDATLAGHLAATTTTEVFVLDAARTLVYRGMIDDQFGLGFVKQRVENPYLNDALDAVAAGEAVWHPATEAQGCVLEVEPIERSAAVTYHNRISRIVQNKCQSCHRPNAPAPFALMNYADVKKKKGMLEWVVEDRVMPPWFAEDGSGPWRNDIGLTETEREDLLGWIEAGAPEGETADAVLPRTWIDGWTIGEPDLIVSLPEPYAVPADGVVDYQYIFAKTDLPEDMWVKSVEILPGAPEVVHHVLVFVAEPEIYGMAQRGERLPRRVFQGGAESFFASAVPGQSGLRYPDGYAKKLPKGSTLTFQMHYTTNGKPALDQTRIGLIFTDEPVVAEVQTNSAYEENFTIPPRAFDFEISAEYVFKEPAAILTLMPHTHLRGSRFLCELIYPDGKSENILHLPLYDFNWQMNYELETPRVVPAGTRFRATAWYDNTADNPANPDPEQWVSFGEQTFDEMMISYFNWVPVKANNTIEASFKK